MFFNCLVSSAAFLPWLQIFQLQLAAGGEGRQSLPGWESVVSIPQLKSIPLVAGKFIYGVLDLSPTPFFVLTGGALLLVGSWILYQLWRQKKKLELSQVQLLLVWFLVPLISAWIVSFWIPVVQPKRVLFLLPAMYILMALIFEKIRTRPTQWAILALLFGLNLFGTVSYYVNPQLQREDWRQSHQEIVTDYPSDSIVVFAFPEPYAPWRWYDDGRYPTLVTGTLHVNQVDDLTEIVEKATDYTYIIVFDYLRDLSDPDRQLETEIEAFGYKLIELKQYPNIGFVRIYGRPGATLSNRKIYETWN
jgi:hypothetical protein